MAIRMHKFMRRVAPLVTAGVIFQTTGCQINTAELAAGLTSTIVTQAVTAWVFNLFSLGTSF